jgi:hypothetical protein
MKQASMQLKAAMNLSRMLFNRSTIWVNFSKDRPQSKALVL